MAFWTFCTLHCALCISQFDIYVTVKSAAGTPDLEWDEGVPNAAEATRVIGPFHFFQIR